MLHCLPRPDGQYFKANMILNTTRYHLHVYICVCVQVYTWIKVYMYVYSYTYIHYIYVDAALLAPI